jgi:thiol-disulfide isomerase/thioredoxin
MKKHSIDLLITIIVLCCIIFYIQLDDTNKIPEIFDESGEKLDLSSPALLHFWSTWSKPSHRDIQVLQRFQKRHSDINVVGIYSSSEKKDELTQIRLEMGIYYKLGVANTFPKSIPLTIVLKDGETHIIKESLQYEQLMELFNKEY